jgi:leucyl/phenylalanyl-tRNA--protein transferase
VYEGNELVGGLYGLSIGAAFFGESMFHFKTDASKIAFHYLARQAQKWNFKLIDCQVNNQHLLSLGCEDISRDEYLEILRSAIIEQSRIESWEKYSPTGVYL